MPVVEPFRRITLVDENHWCPWTRENFLQLTATTDSVCPYVLHSCIWLRHCGMESKQKKSCQEKLLLLQMLLELQVMIITAHTPSSLCYLQRDCLRLCELYSIRWRVSVKSIRIGEQEGRKGEGLNVIVYRLSYLHARTEFPTYIYSKHHQDHLNLLYISVG